MKNRVAVFLFWPSIYTTKSLLRIIHCKPHKEIVWKHARIRNRFSGNFGMNEEHFKLENKFLPKHRVFDKNKNNLEFLKPLFYPFDT